MRLPTVALLVLSLVVLLAASGRTALPTPGNPIQFRKAGATGAPISIGTSGTQCAATGLTASSATVPVGQYMLSVSVAAVGICDGRDADCASTPIGIPPGWYAIDVNSLETGTYHCISGGTGYATLYPLNF